METELSALENAAEDGNVEEFNRILASGEYTQEDLVDSMDTAYRGTQVDPPIEGCFEIAKILKQKGLTVPNYPFYRVRVDSLANQ